MCRFFSSLKKIALEWNTLAFIGVFSLIVVGHLYGKDIWYSLEYERYVSVFNPLNLCGILFVWFYGRVVISVKSFWLPVSYALLLSSIIQTFCIIALPSIEEGGFYYRSSGLQQDPNITLIYVIPIFFLSFTFNRYVRFRELLLFAVPAVMLYSVFCTLSRSGMVIIVFSCVIFYTLVFISYVRPKVFNTHSAVLLLLIMPLMYLYFPYKSVVGKQVEIFSNRTHQRIVEGGGVSDRMIWYRMLQREDEIPLFMGHGYEYYTISHLESPLPHNTFFDVYIVSGWLGFVVLSSFLFIYIKVVSEFFVKEFRGRVYDVSIPAMLVSLFSLILFLLTLSVITEKIVWLIASLIFSRSISDKSNQ